MVGLNLKAFRGKACHVELGMRKTQALDQN